MISKAKKQLIQSLAKKKERTKCGLFLAEGNKLVQDTLTHFECQLLVATKEWIEKNQPNIEGELIEATVSEIEQTSMLRSPQQVLALYKQPNYTLSPTQLNEKLTLALDGVQDPGNLGTIVRLADWFGIENILCSSQTADIYNPKTIQATMGAIARVKVHYVPLCEYLSNIEIPLYGTFLDGENLYSQPLTNNGIIVMGSEGQGISLEIEQLITRKIKIPSYPQNRETSESLNVAMATAIICAEFRRHK